MDVVNTSLALPAETKNAEAFFEKNPQVKLVVIQYVTVSGVVCNRLQPVQSFLHAVKTRGGMHQAIIDLLMPPTGSLLPEIFEHLCAERGVLKPDFSTLRLYPDAAGRNNTAVVVVESTCLDLDPRTNLRRIVTEAKAQHKLDFLTGFEIEVAYLDPQEDELFTSAYRGPIGVHVAAATTRSSLWPVVNETTITLADAGIFVESSHKEYGTSQWEYALPPYEPVESVDAYIFAIETIKNIAQKHGLIASVYPTPYPTEEEKSEEAKEKAKEEPFTRHRNGQHVHISATLDGDDGRSLSSNWNPDELMSGILSHLPALMAFGLSQVDSYYRVGASGIATGGYVGWGDHHRDMPVRRLYRNHWELRFHDGTSNPYAAVGAFISAALDRKPLIIKSTKALPAALTEEQRKELNLVTLLPTSLEEALGKVEADREWVESVLGKEYVYWFLLNKKSDVEVLSKMDVRQRRTLLTKLF